MIFSDQYIDIGVEEYSRILAETAEFFQKVTLNTSKIKDENKLYKSYNIPENEHIIAFCKGEIFFIKTFDYGAVFTEKAFYPYPRKELNLICNRIPYTDLSKYIILRQYDSVHGEYLSNHAPVVLIDEQGEHMVSDPTIIAKNRTSDEMYEILIAIQKELCKCNDSAKERMDETITKLISLFKSRMKAGKISRVDTITLNSFSDMLDYRNEAVCLYAEYEYRTCNREVYKNYLNRVQQIIPTDMFQRMSKPDLVFADSYISDLSNISLAISDEFLIKASDNADYYDDTSQTSKQAVIQTLILMRLFRYNSARDKINKTLQKHGKETALFAEMILKIHGSIQMAKIFPDILQENQIDVYFELIDGLGFTPLHYAIAFSSNDYIDYLLSEHDWSKFVINESENEIEGIFDYSVLACIKNGYVSTHLIRYTDPVVKMLADGIEMLNDQREEAYSLYRSVTEELREAQYHLSYLYDKHAFEEYREAEEKVRELESSYYKIDNTISEIEQKLKKFEKEYYRKCDQKGKYVSNMANKLKQSSNIVVKFLLSLLINENGKQSVDYIFSELRQKRIKVYEFGNHNILLPESINLDDSSYSMIYIAEDGSIINEIIGSYNLLFDETMPPRIYGYSWFSADAHINSSTLSSEYRKLIKQYHPDVCNEKYAHEIFINITKEYESLK